MGEYRLERSDRLDLFTEGVEEPRRLAWLASNFVSYVQDNTLWLSGGGARNPVVGWINTKKFLETGDEAASQGWAPIGERLWGAQWHGDKLYYSV